MLKWIKRQDKFQAPSWTRQRLTRGESQGKPGNAAQVTIPCNCYALTLLEWQLHHLHLLGRHCLAFPYPQAGDIICPEAPTWVVLGQQVGKGQWGCSPITLQHKWPFPLPAVHTAGTKLHSWPEPNTSSGKLPKRVADPSADSFYISWQITQKTLLTSRHTFENLLSRTMNSSASSILQKELHTMKTEGLLPKCWLERRYLWVNVGVGRSSQEASQAVFHFHKLKKLEWMGERRGRNIRKKKSIGMGEITSERSQESATGKCCCNSWLSQRLPAPLRW